jgi:hypothetical protein
MKPGRNYKWYVVGMLWFISFFNYADRQAIFSVFPLLEKQMQAWSIICMATALARNFRHLLAFRAAEGLGETFYYPSQGSGDWAPRSRWLRLFMSRRDCCWWRG